MLVVVVQSFFKIIEIHFEAFDNGLINCLSRASFLLIEKRLDVKSSTQSLHRKKIETNDKSNANEEFITKLVLFKKRLFSISHRLFLLTNIYEVIISVMF